ncbi:MAG: M20 family metallopeptidase [bacterium]
MSRQPLVPADLAERLVEWRRHLHTIPEPGHQEAETALYLAEEIASLGIEPRTGIAGHGILCGIEGERPAPTVLLRADMDGLPIEEKTGVWYASKRPGYMHACGHDAHMACLLGALALLTGDRSWTSAGSVMALFQPAEEVTPSGAIRVLESGVLEEPGPGAVLAQHVDHTLKVGSLAIREGAMMARADSFEVLYRGPGGHAEASGTQPDPLQSAVRLSADLAEATERARAIVGAGAEGEGGLLKCHVGMVEGGEAENVIATTARVAGTTRSFTEVAAAALRKVVEVSVRSAAGRGVEYELHWREGAPPVVNDRGLARRCIDAWGAEIGSDAVEIREVPSLAGEDFGHFCRRWPAVYWRLGIRGVERGGQPWHSARFDIDDEALAVGALAMATAAKAVLQEIAQR